MPRIIIKEFSNIHIVTLRGTDHSGAQIFSQGDTMTQLINEFVLNDKLLPLYSREGNIMETPEVIPRLYEAFVLKGVKKDIDGWKKSLIEINEVFPNNFIILYRLGDSYYRTGDAHTAEKFWYRCIEIDDYQFEAYSKLGAQLRRKGEFNKAIEMLEKAININNNNAHAFYSLGMVYCELKKYDLSEKYIREALKVNRGNIVFQKELAKILMESAKSKMSEVSSIYQNLTK